VEAEHLSSDLAVPGAEKSYTWVIWVAERELAFKFAFF
jgi:hypothetical protein